MRVFRGFPSQNIVACYDEAPGGGDIEDINSPCNAPAKYPAANLALLYWHSDFFQYELAVPLLTMVVNHTALAGQTTYTGVANNIGPVVNYPTLPPAGGILIQQNGQQRTTDIVLMTHGLPEVPIFFVAYEGRILPNGTIVQTGSGQGTRWVSAYANSGVIGLREIAASTNLTLPAVNRTYQVLAFRTPAVDPSQPLAGMVGDDLVIGRGKVNSSLQYLRRVFAAESSFDMDRGPTVDDRNGRTRVVSGGVVTTEDGYTGTFVGPDYIPVGA